MNEYNRFTGKFIKLKKEERYVISDYSTIKNLTINQSDVLYILTYIVRITQLITGMMFMNLFHKQ